MRLTDVEVVMVRPRRGGNVAAACRAMKNCGVGRLTLVDPPADLGMPEARRMAYGAWDVLDRARTVTDLRSALADVDLVAAASARERSGALPPRSVAASLARAGNQRVALVFGPEDSGLTSAELKLAHLQIRIPSHEAQPSLNLAQAVLIVCHEIFVACLGAQEPHSEEIAAHVSAGEFEACIDHLRTAWTEMGYLKPESRDTVLTELRAMLWRARPTQREVTLLRGLARHTLWLARAHRRGTTGPR